MKTVKNLIVPKPCFYCHHFNWDIYKEDDKNEYYLLCENCYMQTKSYTSIELLIKQYNRFTKSIKIAHSTKTCAFIKARCYPNKDYQFSVCQLCLINQGLTIQEANRLLDKILPNAIFQRQERLIRHYDDNGINIYDDSVL